MDSETLKAGIAALAAVVAVISAILAHRAKVQTRGDLFEGERNALVLAMAENDGRCHHLAIQEAFARAELARIHPLIGEPALVEEHSEWLKRIPEAASFASVLQSREYTKDSLDSLSYTERGLSVLRVARRGEQLISQSLSPPTYDLIFSGLTAFVARCEKKSP
ncbi:hypothetical protein [Usitatibacter rugosus]|uniref:hypothetical protein n=1 Tax=Usitatibacter rugosus TaxID=2732067 RepID=UPI0014891D29|nr:hypothetical protein [Usitatibacter rugosus]